MDDGTYCKDKGIEEEIIESTDELNDRLTKAKIVDVENTARELEGLCKKLKIKAYHREVIRILTELQKRTEEPLRKLIKFEEEQRTADLKESEQELAETVPC